LPDRLLVDLGGDGQAVVSSWPDGGPTEEVARAPLAWPLDAAALEDLRWYLEDYLTAPYGVWEDHGPAVAEKLARWGEQVFASVFGDGPARFAYERARDQGLEVVFRSAEPALLGLPWELMRDGAGSVALGAGGISRALPVVDRAQTLEGVLAAVQGERRWRGGVFAGERGFRGGSGCGLVGCDDTVSVSDMGRPSPLPFREARGGP
jgi:hypothetical protein